VEEVLGYSATKLLHSVEESLEWFSNNNHPDLIFLDIQLSDGLSFEIFEKIEIKSAIIFTTAYESYALRAFKLNSIDYLLKPIDEDELAIAIAIAKFKVQLELKHSLSLNFEQIKSMFVSGKVDGLRIIYYQNGSKKSEKLYKKAIPHGISKEYYSNGALSQMGKFVNGKEDGVWEKYYPNGQVKQKSNFKNGSFVGESIRYYSNSKILSSATFEN
jgi:antitoxin component YwqK of YwqJK toxin-antitoxin module